MSKESSFFRYRAVAMCSAMMLAVAAPAFAETDGSSEDAIDCDSRMEEIEDLIREKDMEIPSGALNDIFTLQQQASEACIGGNDEMAIALLDELEDTVMEAVDEGVPTVTAEDVEERMEAESEDGESGSGLVDSMGTPEPGDGEEGFGGESIAETEDGDEGDESGDDED